MIPSRFRFFVAAVAVVFICGGCGKKAPIESLDARAVGDNVLVEGKIVLRGSMPKPDIFLVMDDGTEVIIDGKEMRSELRSLADMPIAIEGEMKSMRDDVPRVEALRYELLRWPTGELPLVGLVSVDMDDVVLAASNGKRYWIRGDLVGVIRDYPGAKVWVIGSLGDPGMAAPKGTIAYWVTGYGVLNETP